jgi:phosphoglycolate phosphatase (TIGR01487 family)
MIDLSNIKVVVIDIDGTITDNDRKISIPAVEALRNLENKGIPVMIATGGVLCFAKTISEMIGLTGPVIAENGGIVHQKCKTNVKTLVLGDKEECEKAFSHLSSHLEVERTDVEAFRLTEVAIYPTVDYTSVKDLVRDYDVKVLNTGFAYHITSSRINKGFGLETACSMMGVDVSNVAAIGDSENDIEMFEKAAIGIAVANAAQKLKERADYVVQSDHGHGVVEALRWLGLI